MTYSKPEVEILGSATLVIQGRKTGSKPDSGDPFPATDCELDD